MGVTALGMESALGVTQVGLDLETIQPSITAFWGRMCLESGKSRTSLVSLSLQAQCMFSAES